MGLWDLVRTEHVVAAAREYDELGQERFLAKYGFGAARAYQLVIDGRSYDSKAIAGVAYRLATGGALTSKDFNGGVGYDGAAWALERLGFTVIKTADTSVSRVASRHSDPAGERSQPSAGVLPDETDEPADLVLLGCVKTKRNEAAPAADLYVSPLFQRRRTYAEESGATWFILSALHGLVAPEQVLEPYDMYLAGQSREYLREWGLRVMRDLTDQVGSLEGQVIEIHAGSTYVDPLEPHLSAAGAVVRVPLRGLTQGGHLAWYDGGPVSSGGSVAPRVPTTRRPAPAQVPVESGPRLADLTSAVEEAARTLLKSTPARASDFPWGRTDLQHAGLYAWWADAEAAADLGINIQAGGTLVYVGQAGATRWPSGKRSDATLMSRIRSQHLGGNIGSSTLRRTLAALLLEELSLQIVEAKALDPASEERLSGWIVSRLSTTVWPTPYRDQLGEIEDAVIMRLNAPLNLRGTASSDLRHRLRQGRRAFGSAEPS